MIKDSLGFVGGARAVVVALSASLFLTMAIAEPLAAAPPALFDSPALVASAPADQHGVRRAAVMRQRPATVNLGLLVLPDGTPASQAGQQIDLNLFPDARFTMTIGDVSTFGSAQTWSGTLDGIAHGYAALVVRDGAVGGQVMMPHGIYRIVSGANGAQVIQQIDQMALPREAPPMMPPPSVASDFDTKVGAEIPDIAADTASQIDVMVLYTPAARLAAGGTAAILAEITLAGALTNQAYANVGLVQRLRPVFVGEIAITENTGPNSFDLDLTALRNNPTVTRLRDFTRADLVSLITDHGPTSPFCGIGFLMTVNSTGFAPNAYTVVELDCAAGNLTFPHELGHNMGGHHDPFVTAGETTMFPYSHGYVDLVGKVRTIMAYPDQCAAAGLSCPKVLGFSSPLFTVNGRVIGTVPTSDNARTLGQTGDTVANFRPALVGPPTASTGVNKTAFAVGESLVVSVGLQNTGRTGNADIYFGLVAPNNTVAFFTDVVITPSSGFAFGNLLNYATYRPIATGVPLTTPFGVNVPSFVSYQWTGGEPRGGYALLLLVVTANALGDGVLATGELIAASLTPFSFPP